jgi:serine protease SohB
MFLAKAVTIVVAIGVVLGLVIGAASKGKDQRKGALHLENLSDDIEHDVQEMQRMMMSKDEQKAFDKQLKKEQKSKKKSDVDTEMKPKMFVLDFDGGVEASEVDELREEISAVISIAKPEDKVLIKLESPGGVVHGYGLAASQIARLKQANIETIAAVDKVAASGGYMMACVADKIIAAPFSIIGSIGVVAQIPNINRLLKKYDVDIEQHTAGNYKRTLTVLGENTEEGREKFKQELAETHVLFKQFVSENRPSVNIDEVATGEHWYGTQAKDKHLVDEIQTSDDFILEAYKTHTLYKVEYKAKQNMAEKLGLAAFAGVSKFLGKLSTWSVTNAK